MSDYIFIRKSRNALSSFLHIFMNILLGVGSIFITLVSGSWILGILLVLLSKWRIFAVRPRYWFINIKSSLVDLIVGSSFIILAYYSGTELIPVHFILAALYVIWLTFIKPKTDSIFTLTQALCAIFFGSTAAILLTSSTNSIILILFEFLIGYGSSRHILAQNSSKNFGIMTLTCGLLCSEIAWLCHSWSILYTFNKTGIIIPQLSIILTLSAYAFAKAVISISNHDGELRIKEILPSTIFSILTVAIIILAFSNPIFNV